MQIELLSFISGEPQPQQEIDFIEESVEGMSAVECKWSKKSKVRFPSTFTTAYSKATLEIITPKNIEGMLRFEL